LRTGDYWYFRKRIPAGATAKEVPGKSARLLETPGENR
jgi:hypothetical protein